MFTAIVLNEVSRLALTQAVRLLGLHLPANAKVRAHHVTLNMGPAKDKSKLGSARRLTVTGYGYTFGRVLAFRVAGAEDSQNKVPHVTFATIGDSKPKESNEIATWHNVAPFEIFGQIEECQ